MRLILALICLALSLTAVAVVETYDFVSDAERKRYNALIDELRCPKCQNQNLAGSDAPIAQDLRREVYRMIKAGDSDQEILTFMHNRYGDFVLYRPRVTLETLALWLGPAVLVLVGGGVWWRLSRAPRQAANAALSQAEEARLRAMLERNDD
ncbi:cytochrome c-type biogenesis protein [Litorivivens sp.]|uniref:cytochrome c-type biogenesis protein n=1 Tax=Litorivivens sp. TaxID=2020868 RepID=UPI00356B0909